MSHTFRVIMAKAGRWLAEEYPEITEPSQWTRQTCAAWVAKVDRLTVGEYVQREFGLSKRDGEPISPRTKAGYLTATRTFFRDCQEWEWIRRRFDPARALATPRSVHALIGPNPRVIADDIWAKLLWAGLNLEPEDLPANSSGPCYPMELIRAVTLTWLFSGQRSDEIARLRVGCIRWQHDGAPIPGDSRDVLAKDAVCLLDVPTHKTGTAFTKPVDPLLGQAIEAWQAIRPDQPKMLDRKTGEHVDLLFAMRARPVAKTYINGTIIPSLCRKAGVPTADVRGNITSHRARSTIASQLYNAKEPMTLFELQAWLGHRSPETTQHYVKITPNKLVKAYSDAGYFERNVRTIEVLVDRDAVTSGAAAGGEPWQYYDLGHGWCTYTFFEQCPHRMACAHCDFYTPKDSSKGQLLEAKENLQRMLASVPLSEEEWKVGTSHPRPPPATGPPLISSPLHIATTTHRRVDSLRLHKARNVTNALPKSAQPGATKAMQKIYNAEDRAHAEKAIEAFAKTYSAKFPKAVAKITDDRDELLAFYGFPAEHWIHLRTTNPIESTFSTVKLRTKVTRGAGSPAAALAMVFKLVESAQTRWRAVRGAHLVALVRTGATFENGVLVERAETVAA